MYLKYFYDESLAQASYMVGCPAAGEALVIDPSRDITPYLRAAQAQGLRITGVTETHIHADYVSGTRELAAATGARIYLSAMGGPDWRYGFEDETTTPLHEGDAWLVGSVRIDVLHTPGHTPEHLSFMVTDTAAADEPLGIFTGDFLFVGTVGRPDLLDLAAGYADTRMEGARQQFANVQRLRELPDYLQIFPGHGAGSACGKSLGAVPTTTLGYEKRFNPAFQFEDEAAFVGWLLADQPEVPAYFAQMKRVNRDGPALLADLPAPRRLTPAAFAGLLERAQLIDTRPTSEFAAGHLPQALHIPASSSQFNTYAGLYVDYTQPVVLIAYESDTPRLIRELRAIGVDELPGYIVPAEAPHGTHTLPQVTAAELSRRLEEGTARLLDVRAASEHSAERIPGALHIPMGDLPQRMEDLPRDLPLALHCASGVRSGVAASWLQRRGFQNAINLDGGIQAWRDAGLPVEQALAGMETEG